MEKRDQVIIKTSIIGIIGNIILVSFKAIIGFIAGSISVIMDALNNLTDALSSVITIVGTKLSNKKPNKKHPYGYGRIEYITSSLIAALILFAGGTAIYESINSIIDHFKNDTLPDFQIYSLIIISAAIIVKIALGIFFRIQGKKADSENLIASGMDALYDAILSLSTLVGAILAYFAKIYVEGYLGIIIGLFIIKSGIEVFKESLSSMIGNRFDKEIVSNIKSDVNKIDGVLGAYDLILNSYGHNKNIGSIHISVDASLTANEIQKIERKISELLYTKYNTIMTVGVYAENNDLESKEIKKELNSILAKYKNVLQLHGFYLDKKEMVCNFDLVISFDEENPDDVISEIKAKISEKYKEYKFVIVFDQDFSLS